MSESDLILREYNGWLVGFRQGDSEPLIRDVDLGARLKFGRPRDIRPLIERMEGDGRIGQVHVRDAVSRTSMPRGGFREEVVKEYWLTEAQALKVAAKSETDVADALLDEMIAVYMAARRGQLPQQKAPPSIQDEHEAELRLLTLRQKAALEIYATIPGLYSEDFLRHKAEHAAALVTGQKPAIENPLLDVQGYLQRRGVSAAERKKRSGQFGKRVKALYLAQHGKPPPVLARDVNGASREVSSYTERDRPLFDEAFDEMFGAPAPLHSTADEAPASDARPKAEGAC